MTTDSLLNNPYASFILRSKTLNPQEITSYLGIMPSKSFKRGDIRRDEKKWTHGYWALESSKSVQSIDLILHIEWLTDQLELVKPKLVDLLNDKSIEAKISCFWIMPTGHEDLILSPKLLQKISGLNLSVLLDIYCRDY